MENDQLLCDETYEDDEKTDLTIDPRRTLVQRLQEHLAQTLAALSEAVADQGNRGRRFAYAVLVLLSSISILVPTVLVIVLRHGFSSPPTVSSDILSLEVISSGANHQFFSNTSLCPEPLSKQLCLLDADTRAWNVSNELDDQDQGVWGRTNHYMYAQVHGYDYKFVQARNHTDLHPTWVKVEEIRRTLQEGYRFVVFTDADIVFPNLTMPLESMFDRWNITSSVAVAAALAPDEANKYDTHGHRNVNTGFLVVQNTPEVMALLTDWLDCPTDVKYPNCSDWRYTFWHEQSAYSEYIRHDEAYRNVTREIPCDDANGAPNHWLLGNKKCSGRFVRHYWVCKECIKPAVEQALADLVMPQVTNRLKIVWDDIYENHANMTEHQDDRAAGLGERPWS